VSHTVAPDVKSRDWVDNTRKVINYGLSFLPQQKEGIESDDSPLSVITGKPEQKLGRILLQSESDLIKAIQNTPNVADSIFKKVTSSAINVEKTQKEIEAIDLEISKLYRKSKLAKTRGERSAIAEKIITLESTKGEKQGSIARTQEGIEAGKGLLLEAAEKIKADATELGYQNQLGVQNAIKILTETSGLLGRSNRLNLSSIGGLVDGLTYLEKQVIRAAKSLAVFIREETRQKGERTSLRNLTNPTGDRELTLIEQKETKNLALGIYKRTRDQRNSTFEK
ncbi:MAG: hypothetical protein ACRDBG_07980, partial [Waterburya sp.]